MELTDRKRQDGPKAVTNEQKQMQKEMNHNQRVTGTNKLEITGATR